MTSKGNLTKGKGKLSKEQAIDKRQAKGDITLAKLIQLR
jgi:hypothetical protein